MSEKGKRFSFFSADRDGIIVLLLVIVVCAVLFQFLPDKSEGAASTDGYADGGRREKHYAQQGSSDSFYSAAEQCELFAFDPNTADSTQLLRLGLRPWQVRSIYKYRQRGGYFYTKEDFAQLYGLTLEKYRQLEPYIAIKQRAMAADYIKRQRKPNYAELRRLGSEEQQQSSAERRYIGAEQRHAGAEQRSNTKLRYGETVDINTADTAELKRIPGIGSYFAQRIVALRQRRKMFATPQELLQGIRNFPETALDYMTASHNFPAIRINKMTQKELEQHPLLNYMQARDIITLRRTTGDVHSIDDLSSISSFTKEHLEKLKRYVTFD